MNNDMIEEIQGELRRDRTVKFIKVHKTQLIFGFAAIFALIIGYTQWTAYKKNKSENWTKQLINIFFDYSAGKDIDLKLLALAEDSHKNLADFATTMNASIKLKSPVKKISENGYITLQNIAKNSSSLITKDIATISLVLYEIDKSVDYKSMISRLELISFSRRPFRLTALELIGVLAIKAGDTERAISSFDSIINDQDATPNMRSRAILLKSRAKL